MKVITIGRGDDNDVMISDITASRHHLQIIEHDDGHYTLSDFGSTNGTFVNGEKISGEIVLDSNDIVRVGNTTIPWRDYFPSFGQNRTSYIAETNYDNPGYCANVEQENEGYATRGVTEPEPEPEPEEGGSVVWPIIGIIISLVMIIGGLSGDLVLRGTGSSIALVVLGFIFLILDIIRLVAAIKK